MNEELGLERLLNALIRKIYVIGICTVVCALLAVAASVFVLTPRYEVSLLFYLSSEENSDGITTSQQNAAQNLVESSMVLLQTRETMAAVAQHSSVGLNPDELLKLLRAEMVEQTEFLRVTVTDTDPTQAKQIADAVGTVLPQRLKELIPGVTMVVAEAPAKAERAGPNHLRSGILGVLAGVVLSGCGILLAEILDRKIRCEADVHNACAYPVLAVIPDVAPKCRTASCPEAEIRRAYGLLRTKLCARQNASSGGCVLGLAGAGSGGDERDREAAICLAQAFSRLGQKVLLIDCDLRKSLPEDKFPGLVGYLSERSDFPPAIRTYQSKKREDCFDIIYSGQALEETAALLASPKMAELLLRLRSEYDRILLTLPPVCEVCDAAAAAALTDGMLLTVRQNDTERTELAQAAQLMEFVQAKVLGVVFHGELLSVRKEKTEQPPDGYLQEVGRRMKSRIRRERAVKN